MASMSDAHRCRRNGWGVGTQLVGDEGYGPTVIEITAIGEKRILAKSLSHNGDRTIGDEQPWLLRYRKWRRFG